MNTSYFVEHDPLDPPVEHAFDADINPGVFNMDMETARLILRGYGEFVGNCAGSFAYSKTELLILACFVNPPTDMTKGFTDVTVRDFMQTNMYRFQMLIASQKNVAEDHPHIGDTILNCGLIESESSEHVSPDPH